MPIDSQIPEPRTCQASETSFLLYPVPASEWPEGYASLFLDRSDNGADWSELLSGVDSDDDTIREETLRCACPADLEPEG